MAHLISNIKILHSGQPTLTGQAWCPLLTTDFITCPPKMTCQECAGTNLDITELSGKGKIVTFTTSNVAPLGREVEAPYTIALVELE
jgi:hypothetical protein